MSEQGIYVSRVNGHDIKECGISSAPCRTIPYAIQKLSTGLYIYLDGTGTLENPYTCQVLYPRPLRIYLNKSISFVSIESRAYISCPHGYAWWTDATRSKDVIRISFSGLIFRNTPVHLFDVALAAHDTVFEKTRSVSLDVQVINLPRFELSLNNVIFKQNSMCINIRIRQADTNVSINITNAIFYKNGNHFWRKPSILSLYSIKHAHAFVGDIQLRNCSLKENIFMEQGMLKVMNRNGNTNVLLKNIRLYKNSQIYSSKMFVSGVFLLVSRQLFLRLEYGFLYRTLATFIRATLCKSAKMSISNVDMDGFNTTIPGAGGLVNINRVASCYLSITDSSFRNGNSHGAGGVLILVAKNLMLTIQNSIIHNISSSYIGGAVYIKSKPRDELQSTNQNFSVFLDIINSSFSYSSSKDGGALCVVAKKLLAIIRNSSFQRCSAKNNGAALAFRTNDNTKISLYNNYFLENSASNIIVAISYGNEAAYDLSIKNVMFVKNNLFSQNGRELAVVSLMTNCTTVVRFNNTHFIENSAGKGSSIYISVFLPDLNTRAHFVMLDTCVFRKNIGYQGAVFVKGKIAIVCMNSIFDSNGALPCRKRSMFTVLLNHSIVVIKNTTFVNNFCNVLRAYMRRFSFLLLSDSAFVRNKNIDGIRGVLRISFTEREYKNRFNALIARVLFKENIGRVSSILTVGNGKVKLNECTFLNNFVRFIGGLVLTSVDASVDLAIFHSVFRQTFPKIVINNTEFVATSFVRLFSVHNLLISNTTFDQQTKSDVSLIFVPSGNLMLIDNSSLSYCPVG